MIENNTEKFVIAVKQNDTKRAIKLLNYGADPDTHEIGHGNTPAHWAVFNKNLPLLKALSENIYYSCNFNDKSPLFWEIKYDAPQEMISYLIEKGISYNEYLSHEELECLDLAIEKGNKFVVEKLTNYGIKDKEFLTKERTNIDQEIIPLLTNKGFSNISTSDPFSFRNQEDMILNDTSPHQSVLSLSELSLGGEDSDAMVD